MKSYQFFTSEGRGGTMLCDDENLQHAVEELRERFPNIIRVQLGTEVWELPAAEKKDQAITIEPRENNNTSKE